MQPFSISDQHHGIVYLPEAFVLPVETELIDFDEQHEATLAPEKEKREAETAAQHEASHVLERKKKVYLYYVIWSVAILVTVVSYKDPFKHCSTNIIIILHRTFKWN